MGFKTNLAIVSILTLDVIVAAACGEAAKPDITSGEEATPPAAVEEAPHDLSAEAYGLVFTPTPEPTATPTDTPIPTPTYTPVPTPTNTPIPTATPTPVPLPDLQISNIDAKFLQVNDNDTSYRLTVTGTYGQTKPDKPFDVEVEIIGLEGVVKKLVHQVTRINDNGTFTLEIPEVGLLDKNSPTYNIFAVVDSGKVIDEKDEDNNKSKVLELKVYEPVTATIDEFNYFSKAVGQSIIKFKDEPDVYVSFYGSADKTTKPSAESIKNFKDGAADIERATNGNLAFRYTEPPADAPVLEVYLDVPPSDFYTIFPNSRRTTLDKGGGAFDWVELTPDGYIKKAKIAVKNKGVNWTVPYPREFKIFAFLNEIINVSGPHIDQNSLDDPIDSILNSRPRGTHEYPQKYSPLDLKVFGILYSPNVKPYMSPNDVRKFIRVTN